MIIIGGHQGFALNRSRKSSALVHLGDTLSITAGGYKTKPAQPNITMIQATRGFVNLKMQISKNIT